MLPMRRPRAGQPGQHVRQLHPRPGGHHRGHPEGGDHHVVQGVQQVPRAPEGVGARGAGVEGAPHLLHQEAEGAQQGEAGGRRLHLDRAPLEAPQGEADDPEGGVPRHHPAADVPGGLRDPQPPVPRVPTPGRQRRPMGGLRAGAAARGPQAHLLPPRAAHPQAQRPGRHAQHQGAAGRCGLLLWAPVARAQVHRVSEQRGADEEPLGQAAGELQRAKQRLRLQVYLFRADRAHLQGGHLPPPPEGVPSAGVVRAHRGVHAHHQHGAPAGPSHPPRGERGLQRLLPPTLHRHHVGEAPDGVRGVRHGGRGAHQRPLEAHRRAGGAERRLRQERRDLPRAHAPRPPPEAWRPGARVRPDAREHRGPRAGEVPRQAGAARRGAHAQVLRRAPPQAPREGRRPARLDPPAHGGGDGRDEQQEGGPVEGGGGPRAVHGGAGGGPRAARQGADLPRPQGGPAAARPGPDGGDGRRRRRGPGSGGPSGGAAGGPHHRRRASCRAAAARRRHRGRRRGRRDGDLSGEPIACERRPLGQLARRHRPLTTTRRTTRKTRWRCEQRANCVRDNSSPTPTALDGGGGGHCQRRRCDFSQ
mmetsp:Transcript_31015/g.67746  ORF Transcript_31015/g.67746 Transcript_31015/m.67746 type:complete len:588 (+) Transcript_31015:678-2441(+)